MDLGGIDNFIMILDIDPGTATVGIKKLKLSKKVL